MRRFFLLLLCILTLCMLTACSAKQEDDFDETTISIDKKGHVTQQIVESFSKEYYDVGELENEFVSAINAFDRESGTSGRIKMKSIATKGTNVYVKLNYDNVTDYSTLMKETLFVGTINEAYDAGYTMDVTLKGTESGDKIGKVEIMGMTDRHIIIVSEPVKFRTYRDIAYVSANVELIDKRSVRVLSESGGLAYLILDK